MVTPQLRYHPIKKIWEPSKIRKLHKIVFTVESEEEEDLKDELDALKLDAAKPV